MRLLVQQPPKAKFGQNCFFFFFCFSNSLDNSLYFGMCLSDIL